MTQRKRFEAYQIKQHGHVPRWLGKPLGYPCQRTNDAFEDWQAAERAVLPPGYVAVQQTALDWLFGETEFKKPDNAFGVYWWRTVFRHLVEDGKPTGESN